MSDLCIQLDTSKWPKIRHIAYPEDQPDRVVAIKYPVSDSDLQDVRAKLEEAQA